MTKKIKTALISVFSKEGLSSLLETLKEQKVSIYSTGGTYDFLKEKGMDVHSVESLTGFPSILGGRVKTLHPLVFGGILGRKSLEEDRNTMLEYGIPEIDLVVVDLYPFEETLAMGASEKDIIEKIDIGGISLIRAAAKNFEEVLIVPSTQYYEQAAVLLKKNQGETSIEDRRCFASYAFKKSSEYDT
ncbi:MAG: IMP cyclohydrolase, partial [Bacteroidales bacterium]